MKTTKLLITILFILNSASARNYTDYKSNYGSDVNTVSEEQIKSMREAYAQKSNELSQECASLKVCNSPGAGSGDISVYVIKGHNFYLRPVEKFDGSGATLYLVRDGQFLENKDPNNPIVRITAEPWSTIAGAAGSIPDDQAIEGDGKAQAGAGGGADGSGSKPDLANQWGSPEEINREIAVAENAEKSVENLFKKWAKSKSAFEYDNTEDSEGYEKLAFKKGSSTFKRCQAMFNSEESFKTFNTRNLSDVAIAIAYEKLKDDKEDMDDDYNHCFTNNGRCSKETSRDEVAEHVQNAMREALKEVRKCVVMRAALQYNFDAGYDDNDDLIKGATATSFDSRIKCKSDGFQTLDFVECKHMAHTYTGAQLALTGQQLKQGLDTTEKGQEEKMRMIQNGANGDISTAALESQKSMIDQQQDMAESRRAAHAAKMATMWGLVAKIPNTDTIVKACVNKLEKDVNLGDLPDTPKLFKTAGHNILFGEATVDITSTISSKIDYIFTTNDYSQMCENVLIERGLITSLLRNQQMVTMGQKIVAEAGIDATKEHMNASTLSDQSSLVGATINKIKGAEMIDGIPFNATEDQIVTFCQANPNHPDCAQFMSGGGMNFSGIGMTFDGGFAPIDSGANNIDDPDTVDVAGTNPDGSPKAIVKSGKTVGAVDKGSGFKGAPPAAAKVTSNGTNTNAASGGGGADASAAGLSGGGGPGGENSAVGNNRRKGSGYKLSYGGGNRKLSFSGGRGSKRSKKPSGSGNPFGNMFGKDKPSAGPGVLNFRGIASKGIGGKKGSIFERITGRYGAISSEEGRLLKYKSEKLESLE